MHCIFHIGFVCFFQNFLRTFFWRLIVLVEFHVCLHPNLVHKEPKWTDHEKKDFTFDLFLINIKDAVFRYNLDSAKIKACFEFWRHFYGLRWPCKKGAKIWNKSRFCQNPNCTKKRHLYQGERVFHPAILLPDNQSKSQLQVYNLNTQTQYVKWKENTCSLVRIARFRKKIVKIMSYSYSCVYGQKQSLFGPNFVDRQP